MLQLYFFVCIRLSVDDFALVAELVDAADLKSVGSNPVPVRFRPSAPIKKRGLYGLFFLMFNVIDGYVLLFRNSLIRLEICSTIRVCFDSYYFIFCK